MHWSLAMCQGRGLKCSLEKGWSLRGASWWHWEWELPQVAPALQGEESPAVQRPLPLGHPGAPPGINASTHFPSFSILSLMDPVDPCFSLWSPRIILKSFSGQLHSRTSFSVYSVFCSLWCNTLPLAIVHVMLFRELIFLNYANQPVQVTCPSLLFRTPAMLVSPAGILSSDLKSS